MATKFKALSGRVICEPCGRDGVIEAVYTGAMTPQVFSDLRNQALRHAHDATAFVVRLDTALILMGDAPAVDSSAYADAAPGALIVRHDPHEYAKWTAYARECGRHGVVRTVWTERYAAQAYQWALIRSAGLQQAELH